MLNSKILRETGWISPMGVFYPSSLNISPDEKPTIETFVFYTGLHEPAARMMAQHYHKLDPDADFLREVGIQNFLIEQGWIRLDEQSIRAEIGKLTYGKIKAVKLTEKADSVLNRISDEAYENFYQEVRSYRASQTLIPPGREI